MSSTNRGAVRQAHDYYATPPDEIRRFLAAFIQDEPHVQDVERILDPCAGGNRAPVEWEYKPGKILTVPPTPMAYPSVLVLPEALPYAEVITSDIREDSPAVYQQDFLQPAAWGALDMVISNPPFVLALEFIQQALDAVIPGGWVVMLLRLNFLGSQKRKPFFDATPPYRVYVHHERMSFTPDGRADSVEYMHAVWRRGVSVVDTKLRVI